MDRKVGVIWCCVDARRVEGGVNKNGWISVRIELSADFSWNLGD